jgi:hypothetical protein
VIRSWANCPTSITWNGVDSTGKRVPSGTYYWHVTGSPLTGTLIVQ